MAGLNPRSTAPSVRSALVSENRPFNAQQDRNFKGTGHRSKSGNTPESLTQLGFNHPRSSHVADGGEKKLLLESGSSAIWAHPATNTEMAKLMEKESEPPNSLPADFIPL
jgi:hypothetical protein